MLLLKAVHARGQLHCKSFIFTVGFSLLAADITGISLQVKKLNTELNTLCPTLRSRVDDLDRSNALVTRAASGAGVPHSADEGTSSLAGSIVEESVAEAAALVHHLFEKQVAANGNAESASESAPAPAATAVSGQDEAEAGTDGRSASRMSLFVDDEILMQMSTKLTAMFIAIQRWVPSISLHWHQQGSLTLFMFVA